MRADDRPPPPRKPRYALLLRLGMWRGVLAIMLVSILASMVMTPLLMLLIGVPDDSWPRVLWGAALVPIGVAGVVGTVVMRMLMELDAVRRQVQELAVTDGLTGICNRRHFLELAEAEFLKSSRYGLALSVLMVDVDVFKALNDRHGHAIGDEVLRRIAGVATQCLRRADLLARYGGEEFVVLLPLTETGPAAEVAERLRAGVEDFRLDIADGEPLGVTVSVGVATRTAQTPSLHVLLQEADRALYRAKAAGRNRVEVG